MGSQLIDAVAAAYPSLGRLFATHWACREACNEGWHVRSGGLVSPNASAVTTITTIIASSTFNENAHGLVAGDTVIFSGISTTTGVTNGTVYFVSATGLTANAFRVAATSGGAAITLGGTADTNTITATQVGKVDLAAAVDFVGTTERKVAAVTAFATTIASLAPAAGNEIFVLAEVDAAGVMTYNAGTAAPFDSAVPPALTASRVPHALLYIRAGATELDLLTSSANGKAKLIDLRELITYHAWRKIASILTRKAQGNPQTPQRIIDTNAITIPDLSVSVGDVYTFEIAIAYVNTLDARTVQLVMTAFGSTVFDWTTPSLAADANLRDGYIRGVIQIQSNTSLNTLFDLVITAPVALTGGDYLTPATAASAQRVAGTVAVPTLATATGLTIDLTAKLSGSSAGSIIATNLVSISKQPV